MRILVNHKVNLILDYKPEFAYNNKEFTPLLITENRQLSRRLGAQHLNINPLCVSGGWGREPSKGC